MSLSSLGIIVVLISLSIAGLIYLVDINRHKDKIVNLLKKHTGRAFQVQDRIRITVYPWVGLNLGKVRIGNAQGFEETDFIDIHGVKARIKFLPLLARRVIIDTVRLEGMDINLMRNADGVTNWDDLVQLALQAVAEQENPTVEQKKWKKLLPSPPKMDQLPIDLEKVKILGLDVKNLNLTFDDHVLQSVFKLSCISMKTSEVSLNQPVQVQVNATASARNLRVMDGLAFDAEMEVDTKVTMKIEKSIDLQSLPAE